MTMTETIDGQTGEVMTPAPVAQMTIPTATALPVLVETLGEDGIHERVQRALDTPGAIQDLHGKPYIGFIGSAVIASKLGVSVSTGNIQSRIAADGVMEYICEARVLGPHGSIVAVECIMSLADAKGSGMRLDRGQLVNKLSTRAFNRALKIAWGGYIFVGRNGQPARVVNTIDDARPEDDDAGMPEPPRLYGDELDAAAQSYTEAAVAAKGDSEQVKRIHAQAVAAGLRWDKSQEHYVPQWPEA